MYVCKTFEQKFAYVKCVHMRTHTIQRGGGGGETDRQADRQTERERQKHHCKSFGYSDLYRIGNCAHGRMQALRILRIIRMLKFAKFFRCDSVCVRVRACVRACVSECVRVCVCVRGACVSECVRASASERRAKLCRRWRCNPSRLYC